MNIFFFLYVYYIQEPGSNLLKHIIVHKIKKIKNTTVGTVPKSNLKIVEIEKFDTPLTNIHDSWHSWKFNIILILIFCSSAEIRDNSNLCLVWICQLQLPGYHTGGFMSYGTFQEKWLSWGCIESSSRWNSSMSYNSFCSR